jgi:hypothetical protein
MLRNLEVHKIVVQLLKESYYIVREISARTPENLLLLNIIESKHLYKT